MGLDGLVDFAMYFEEPAVRYAPAGKGLLDY
jgi:hypothetical protein